MCRVFVWWATLRSFTGWVLCCFLLPLAIHCKWPGTRESFFSAMKSTLHNSHVQKWWYPHIICIGNMQGNDREYHHVRKLPMLSFNCLVVATAASSTWRTKRHKERIHHRHLPQSLSNISKSKLQSIKCGSNVYLMPWLNVNALIFLISGFVVLLSHTHLCIGSKTPACARKIC